jgi:beta-lactam-binding protein with PASTA domain
VTIYVSAGAPQSTVPSVVGMSESAARTKIATAGFVASVSYVPGSTPGVVVSQSPAAGAKMTPGSTVSISVTQGGGGLGFVFPWTL